MNQSIDNVEGNLKKYLSVTENICTSIDVILEKVKSLLVISVLWLIDNEGWSF